jgi:AraC family transcriptional regulator of adaptative response / DNA-3-methyladenine glycosylase II
VAIAQTRRVHFAKRLIDETNLPMTEVAMASGFGSIRRFNATFRGLYGRSPSELRRHKVTHAPGQYEFRLEYRPPYDWDSIIAFLSLRATPGVEIVTPDEYRRTISLDGEAGTISVRQARGHALVAHIRFPRPAALFRIVERIRRIFDLGADPSAISAALKKDPQLRPLVAERPGLRVPGCWDGFELAVRAVLGQQVSVKGASTLAGRLASAFGTDTGEGILFPVAETLAYADLSRIGLTSARVRTIHSLAQAVVGGLAVEDTAGLTGLPGIGEWTAQYIAMRLGEPDAFPDTDLYLRAHASRAEAWRPWRAYAAMHLWSSNKKVPK